MCPIKGLSEQLRMPRLGKIHLGYKDEKKKGAPTATDYFVCPDEIKVVCGDKPKQLSVMIPTEDEEYWASQYYRAYSQTRGLICRGDGEKGQRMVDISTKEIAGKNTESVAWEEGICAGKDCPIYQETRRGFPKCGEVMCLQFMLPDVPGVGVWQIDTGSINSIRNINSEAHLIKKLCGHISMLPLLLTLEPEDKPNPETGKQQRHYFLHLRERDTLQKLLADSQKPVFELLAPPVDEAEVARDIAELWPAETEPEPPPDAPERQTKSVKDESNSVALEEAKPEPEVSPVDEPKPTIKTIQALLNWVASHGRTYTRTWVLSNFGFDEQKMRDNPYECYLEIKQMMEWTI